MRNEQGSDFLYHWISDHLPDDPISDPVLLTIVVAVDAKRAAEAQGIPGEEIDEEIGKIYKFLMQGLRKWNAGNRVRQSTFFPKVMQNDPMTEETMKIKMLTMGAMALALMTGSALAAGNTSALDDPAKMSPFFTDAGMKTLKTEKDFKAAWTAMKPDEQKAVLKDCGDTTLNKSHADFCAMAKKMGG